ncbi:MAG: hypothetical protein R3E34_13730 [Rhodocyclaceae bacterium]
MDNWVAQAVGVLDALDIDQADLVGEFLRWRAGPGAGDSPSAARAAAGADGQRRRVPFEITAGLDAVWGYTPSLDNMRALLDLFAWDRTLVNDELAQLRYDAGIRPAFGRASPPCSRPRASLGGRHGERRRLTSAPLPTRRW